jgi:hypothetical protein
MSGMSGRMNLIRGETDMEVPTLGPLVLLAKVGKRERKVKRWEMNELNTYMGSRQV